MLTDISTCDRLSVNTDLVVGDSITSNNIVTNEFSSNTVSTQSLILQSQDIFSILQTSNTDIQELESSVNNLQSVKADITYVNQKIDDLIGGASGSYDTLLEIQNILNQDEANITSLINAVNLKAADNNTVHLNQNETITGSKQFNGGIVVNSNVTANNKTILPSEIGWLQGTTSAIQPQLNSANTAISTLQPQQTSVTATTILNDNYRSNCWFVITASTSINITLPNPNNNIGKIFYFTNQSASACNIIGNGSTIKFESNVGVWSTLASMSITPNATISISFKSDGYVVLYNSYVALQLNTSTNGSVNTLNTSVTSLNTSVSSLNTSVTSLNTSVSSLNSSVSSTNTNVSALQTKTQMVSYEPNSTVVKKTINGTSSVPTLSLYDINNGNLFYFLLTSSGGAYNLMTNENDALLLARSNLTIAPWSAKNVGIRMTDSDLTIGASTIVPLDNKIVLDGTNKTIAISSPNWIAANNSICAPDFRLITTNESISDIIGALRTEDTVLSDQVSAARQETYDLSQNAVDPLTNKCQKITYDATNKVTKFDKTTSISTSMLRYGDTTVPQSVPLLRGWGLFRNDTGFVNSFATSSTPATLSITKINTGRYGVNLTGDAYQSGYLSHVQVQLVTRGENGYGQIRGFTSYVKHNPANSIYTWEIVVYSGGSSPVLVDSDFTIYVY
jgi:prefoldin subunit 5